MRRVHDRAFNIGMWSALSQARKTDIRTRADGTRIGHTLHDHTAPRIPLQALQILRRLLRLLLPLLLLPCLNPAPRRRTCTRQRLTHLCTKCHCHANMCTCAPSKEASWHGSGASGIAASRAGLKSVWTQDVCVCGMAAAVSDRLHRGCSAQAIDAPVRRRCGL